MYRVVDAERVADLVQLLFVPLADGVHVGVGMGLIDRNELRPETQADDRHVDFFVRCFRHERQVLRKGDESSVLGRSRTWLHREKFCLGYNRAMPTSSPVNSAIASLCF